MSAIVTKTVTATKTAVSLVKAVGPLLVSQFDFAKFKYLDQKEKQAQLAALGEFLLQEAKALSELKSEIRRDCLTKSGMERLEAEEKARLIDKEVNKLFVYSKIPSKTLYLEKDLPDKIDEDNVEAISETWLDRFNNLAGGLNEEWRQSLLADAFAVEASKPGTISLDTILAIGRLDQSAFHYFAALLSIASKLYEVFCIPSFQEDIYDLKVKVLDQEHDIGNLIYRLEHTGLISTNERAGIVAPANQLVQIQYGGQVLAIMSQVPRHYPGIFTTSLGSSLGSLCSITPNETGFRIFDNFEQKLIADQSLLKRWVV